MEYEVVNLDEKIVAGVSARTSNDAPDMGSVIGELWNKLYQGGIGAGIKNKVNTYAIGLYSDYEGDSYCVTAGNEVSSKEGNEGVSLKVIPAGRYAKFLVHGDMMTVVAQAWEEIWKTPLDRSYKADFEEYLNADAQNADVALYISLN
ncbi:MAG: AraC family transcriptional regulator [Lachnospiraceae bacterium]|nr:AraC family transcriptional regulator [Lachnospiraceae bacterium]